jgi:hypothetical protein
MQKRANLVDTFKSAPAAAPVPAAVPSVPSAASSVSKASVAAGGKQTVAQWFQKNWGKALAVVIVVVITTIFIVRTVLIAKQKKRAKEQETRAVQGQGVEWNSFLGPPLPVMPPMGPPPHFAGVRGAAPRPVMPAPAKPLPHGMPAMPPMSVPPPPTDAAAVERGFTQQRLPPADGQMGAGLSIMPESSRPQNSTFTITTELPVADVPAETEPTKKKQVEAEPPALQADVDSPSRGTEFNR